ncbi:MAG: hypothetical protein ACJA0Q_000287 [Saprospiraceae bacterium]|jgi:hypothetical protein
MNLGDFFSKKMKLNTVTVLLLFMSVVFVFASPIPSIKSRLNNFSVQLFLKEYQKDFHPNVSFNEMIFVSIKHQRLYYLKGGKVQKYYDVSTSRFGVGSMKGSKKTPIGLHKIQNKIGVGCPMNSILKMGYCSGKIAKVITEPVHGPNDHVTTRILWLNGMEEGINRGGKVDTYNRNIYIHGTVEEGLIGKRASHGCVRMKNTEVLELFNKVKVNCVVLILNH